MRLRTTGEGRQGPLLQRQPCVGQRLIYTDRLSFWFVALLMARSKGQQYPAVMAGGGGSQWQWLAFRFFAGSLGVSDLP